jgi:hypothetical protein
VQQFASDLRTLRDTAGPLPYRVMSDQAHYSKATLATAAAGHRLPTLDVTLAYVVACGGNREEWRQRWHETRHDLGVEANELPQKLPANVAMPTQLTWRRRSFRRLLGGLGVAAIVTASVLTILIWPASAPISAAAPPYDVAATPRFIAAGALSAQPVVDGADPKRTGCSNDPYLTTIDSVEMDTQGEHWLGNVELRYSPHCHATWGRFSPAPGTTELTGAKITIVAMREKDRPISTQYEDSYVGLAVFGNLLPIGHGCVRATVTVRTATTQASATTACVSGS